MTRKQREGAIVGAVRGNGEQGNGLDRPVRAGTDTQNAARRFCLEK